MPGVMDIVEPVEVSRVVHTYCGRVTLQHNVKYYATLTAYHGGNDKLNVTASSNGGTQNSPYLESSSSC